MTAVASVYRDPRTDRKLPRRDSERPYHSFVASGKNNYATEEPIEIEMFVGGSRHTTVEMRPIITWQPDSQTYVDIEIFPENAYWSRIESRLNELRKLEDGWLDGDGYAPAEEGLDWLASVLKKHYSSNLPNLYLYPTEEGGVQIEWHSPGMDMSIAIDFESYAAIWSELDTRCDSDHYDERPFDCSDENDWRWLFDRLADYS